MRSLSREIFIATALMITLPCLAEEQELHVGDVVQTKDITGTVEAVEPRRVRVDSLPDGKTSAYYSTQTEQVAIIQRAPVEAPKKRRRVRDDVNFSGLSGFSLPSMGVTVTESGSVTVAPPSNHPSANVGFCR